MKSNKAFRNEYNEFPKLYPKKKHKKLDPNTKQKPKYSHQIFSELTNDLDEIVKGGMNLNLEDILSSEEDFDY